MFTFFLLNAAVGLSSFILAGNFLKPFTLADFLQALFITFLSQIVLTELLLGLFGILTLPNIFLINALIMLLVVTFMKNHRHSLQINVTQDTLGGFLKNKTLLFAIGVISVFGLVKIFINLVNPPFGWDSLNYHFTFPVEWMKHGNLDMPITVFDDPSPAYYPITGSLFYLWLILPLKNVFLADLGQVPFFILSFLAVYSISRKIGIKRDHSLYAAVLFFLIPNFFKQLSIAYVDVMVAGLFFVCVNWLFLLEASFSWQNVLIFSLSLGLLLGTKTVALPYSILLLIPFIYLCFKNIKRFYLFIILIFGILALGSFSYLRNFINAGNPFYPLGIELFGKPVFKGVLDINTYRAHFKPEDYRLGKLLFHEGLGAQTLIFVLPVIFLALPAALIKKRRPLSFNLVYLMILPILLYLVYRYVIPLANVRYLYPLLGIGMVLGFYLIENLHIPRVLVKILVVICALASMSELAKRTELVTSIMLTFLSFFLLLYLIKNKKLKIAFKPLTIASTVIFLSCGLLWLEPWYLKNEFPRYTKMRKYSGFWEDATIAWDWLNRNTAGQNIAYAGRPVPFPLYGSSFKNNVYYVSINKTEPAKLHYYPDSRYQWGYDFSSLHNSLSEKGNYRSDADDAAWLSNLTKRKIDYLFVYSLHQTKDIEFSVEDKWAKGNPDRFTLVFSNPTIHIYKIRK